MKETKPSRRSMLISSATGLSAAWVASHWPAILEAQEHAAWAKANGQPLAWGYLTPEQSIEVEAIAAQIIPTDDTPGAREAGVIYFIDHALVTFERDAQSVYRQGLMDLQAKTAQMFPGTGKFSALSNAHQIEVLKAIEDTPFFRTVRNHTVIGFFANPVHGGNRDEAGWKLIEYDGSLNFKPPFGYYDARMEQDKA